MHPFSNNCQGAIIKVNSQGIISFANPFACLMFGYQNNELENKHLSLVLPNSDETSGSFGGAETIIKDIKSSNMLETFGFRKDGSEFPIKIVVESIPDGYICFVRDISKQQISKSMDMMLHATLRRVLRGQKPEQFCSYLCEKIVELLGSPLVWIGKKEKDGFVTVTAKAGRSSDNFPKKTIRWDDLTETFGPAGKAIRSKRSFVVALEDDKVIDENGREHIRQILAFPLVTRSGVEGVLEIHSNAGMLDNSTIQRFETFSLRVAIALQIASDQQKLRLQRTAMEISPNAFAITDKDGEVLWINKAFTTLSGYSEKEVLNRPLSFLKTAMQNEAFYTEMWDVLKAGKNWQGEIKERHKTGALFTVEQRITPILDADGNLSYCVIVRNDVTERKYAEGQLLHLVNYDQLTGLPNRRLFQEQLKLICKRAESEKKKFAVIFADLTNFSRINDTLGHAFGDELLDIVSKRLSKKASAKDFIARIGGDEFAMIVEDVRNTKFAALKARSMIETILAPITLGDAEVNVGACVGISIYPDDDVDCDKLVNYADMALRKAAHSSPNSYFFFSQEMNEETEDRLSLERDLRKGLMQNEFALYFQPQFDVRLGKVTAVEALVRWFHPERGMIPPVKFIPIAEDTGLIIPLGNWILKKALEHLKQWDEMGVEGISVAVNLSAIQFQQEDLAGSIEKTLKASGIDSSRLELELTESVVMQDASKADNILSRLSKVGIKLAIDDFGTGYSSLSYLKRFAVDRLKIDRSFVQDMTNNYDDAEIAHAIINLGHTLGLEIVSEGVETKEQLELLKKQGCDIIQGYYIAKPMPADEFPNFIKTRTEF